MSISNCHRLQGNKGEFNHQLERLSPKLGTVAVEYLFGLEAQCGDHSGKTEILQHLHAVLLLWKDGAGHMGIGYKERIRAR